VKAGAVGVKVSFEPGFAAPVWRLHPPEIERAYVDEAKKRNLPIYAHAERAEMVRRALAIKPHALVHGPIDGTPELAREIAALGIPVITTQALFDAHAVVLHPEQLDDPISKMVIDPLLMGSLRSPEQYKAHVFGLLTEVTGFVPGLYRNLLVWGLTTPDGLVSSDEQTHGLGKSAMATIRHLRDAKVPLVMGSDSGNWPLFPYYFHGLTSWRELRLLAQAGLTPTEVLQASTINAVRMLGWEDRLGTVEVGKLADLVVVREDPVKDVEKAMRSLEHVVRGGVAHTPREWMELP
jgi:imidazolonepropionase-like amidohydrolase